MTQQFSLRCIQKASTCLFMVCTLLWKIIIELYTLYTKVISTVYPSMAYIKYLPIYPYPAGNLLQHSKITWTTPVYIKLDMMVSKLKFQCFNIQQITFQQPQTAVWNPKYPHLKIYTLRLGWVLIELELA